MAGAREVLWADIEAAAKIRDPSLADLVVRYMAASDPPEDRPEDADPRASVVGLPEGAWTMRRLRQAIAAAGMGHKTPEERQAARRAAWASIEAAPHAPPRLHLGTLMVELYDAGDEAALEALREIIARARIGWGFWQGFKQIYKKVEARHDAAMFGLMAWRLDTFTNTAMITGEVGRGTLIYMRRRAWRYLRELGAAVPEAYPQFAVEVLRHYTQGTSFYSTWVASQIWGHEVLVGMGSGGLGRPMDKIDKWAYPDAWKLSKTPLLSLLEHAGANEVCAFAILGLEQAFADDLREVEPAWLLRLGEKWLPSVHDFVVRLLDANPRFHASKLAALGLEPLIVRLLTSPSANARKHALAHVRGQSTALDVSRLVEMACSGFSDAQAFALERLTKMSPRDIGLPALARMVADRGSRKFASEMLRKGFAVTELSQDDFVDLMLGGHDTERFLDAWYKEAKAKPPAAYLQALLDDPRQGGRPRSLSYGQRRVLRRLADRSAKELGVAWLQEALLRPALTSTIAGWLTRGKLQGANVDIVWFKSLIARPKLRPTALAVLSEPKWVDPVRLGVQWLLDLLRHPDPELRAFARRHLLEHFTPEQLSEGQNNEGCWALLGPSQPEAVREFAITYLRLHHPELGPLQPEARELGVTPRLDASAFTADIVVPRTDDPRADVRRFAAELVQTEIRRWNDASLPYRLAESPFAQTRAAGGAALLLLGDPDAPPERALPESWLQTDATFALAESAYKSTREVALTLIRRHYAKLGGAQRLAWLMESPDREVRLFAVRLLWDQHRPRDGAAVARRAEDATGPRAFDTTQALREFLRTVLFGLPPGRMERRAQQGDVTPDAPLPASVAKRRLVEVLRDFAIEDADFAAVVSPVLETFASSQARGERDACLAALVALRAAHPALELSVRPTPIEVRAPKRARFGHAGGAA